MKYAYHLWVDYRHGQLETAYPSLMMISVYIVWHRFMDNRLDQERNLNFKQIPVHEIFQAGSQISFGQTPNLAWGTYSLYTLALQQVGTFTSSCTAIAFHSSTRTGSPLLEVCSLRGSGPDRDISLISKVAPSLIHNQPQRSDPSSIPFPY